MNGSIRRPSGQDETIWQQVVDALEEPVLIVDGAERILTANRAALRELHCTEARARELSLSQLLGEPWSGCRALLQLVRVRGGERERELRESRSGRHWSIRCSGLAPDDAEAADHGGLHIGPVPAGGPSPEIDRFLLILRDTTEFHLLGLAMKQYERTTLLADLVGGLAHQVNNPLFAISGILDCLKQQAVPSSADEEMLAALDQETRRLSSLMHSFVEFASAACRSRSRHDLAGLVREACGECGLLGTASPIMVDLQLEDGVEALVDRQALCLALTKILENSRDLSPAGTTVLVSGRRVATDTSTGLETWYEVQVRDRGPGIPPAFRRKVFEPFFSRRSHHHGLGLALAQRILVGHGGSVSCGESDVGALVIVQIPTGPPRRPGNKNGERGGRVGSDSSGRR